MVSHSFITPSMYVYSESDWETYAFAARMEAMADSIIAWDHMEARGDLTAKLFRFRASNESIETLYTHNPLINSPALPNFYIRKFTNDILPALMRRFDVCPGSTCVGTRSEPRRAPTFDGMDDIATDRFLAALELCGLCAGCGTTCLISHPDAAAFVDDHGFFDHVFMAAEQVLCAADPTAAFPWVEHKLEQERLEIALAIRLAQYQAADATWEANDLGRIAVGENFWRSLRSATFREHDEIYKRRILEVLVQIAADRDVDIHEHRMVTQTVAFEGGKHGKWNAYVFQSGASAQDRRCSRIYFAKIAGGVFLESYDQDAH